jgi:hypothetical protein
MSKQKSTKEVAPSVLIPDVQKDLDQMHQYVEAIKKGGERGFSLVATETFVESMRDSGYKSTGTALDELIDNAIQARASRVDVLIQRTPNREEIAAIAVVDDGHGMEPDMVRAAVRWGGTHRAGNREGFGRFGFGLPSASVSITREFEVFSKLDGEDWYAVRIELEKVVRGALTTEGVVLAPAPTKKDPPEWVKSQLGEKQFTHGTVVVLEKPDRLTPGFKKAGGFVESMMEHIGLVYRGILRACEICVDSKRVQPVDPLFLDPSARYYDVGNGVAAEGYEPMAFEMKTTDSRTGEQKTGFIRLRFSYMPPKFQRATDGSQHKGRLGVMKDNHSWLIVCRAGRQLDAVWRSHFPKGENKVLLTYDRNWAIELDFDPSLDEEFGVTVNKQQVTLSERVWAILADRGVNTVARDMWRRFEKESKAEAQEEKNEVEEVADAEAVAAEAQKFQAKVVRQTPEKEQAAVDRVTQDAAKVAKEQNRSPEEVIPGILQDIAGNPYRVMFEQLEGAPMYRVERYGAQLRLHINMRHRFYTDLYAAPDTTDRTKTALLLMLLALGVCEVDSTGDRETFYRAERGEWSKTVDLYFATLDRRKPLEEARAAADA